VDPRQQGAEFGCDTGSGFLLQAALAQHAFEKGAISNQARPGGIGRAPVRECALEHRFPAGNKAVIEPYIGREQGAFRSCAEILDRAELDFNFARFGDGRVRPVKWTIGLRAAAPAGKEDRRRQRRDAPPPFHGAGRNTQVATGSFDLARTATKSRSRSGTKSEVRAPDTVGTRARRR
jgi:hypothetical protein